MARALENARRALGSTAPNPAVGAVIVRDGALLGEGFTQPVGGPHAEVRALADCRARGHDPAGATLYVTLEPCCHHGRTPPCTDAVLAAGIARVVVGTVDPYEPMQGRSLELLREHGVDVDLGVCEAECRRAILGFARAITRGLPEVTVKTAISADGRIATASGESQWITGEAARAVGQRLRAEHDAILVGIGTVLADDPRLTCRLPGAASPVPVVLDSRGRFPAGCALDRPETLVFQGPGAQLRAERAQRVEAPVEGGRLALRAVLGELAKRGLHRVLVEGGGEVIRSVLDARLADTVEMFVAGKVVPGGRPWVGGPPIASLGEALCMKLVSVATVGADAHLTWRLEHDAPPEVSCSPDW
ncbi:MAG: bifunctional diaminohydroxyphosphoribosylaminopyrimidine deaminase/5-amino-6-(5-phosphoribosylamino)uracil reductase RibD [Alphaproteobacteria bacterium]|nr:bifunctional diaminohydroxyphosphoribosylaminopyrimidine deaminase/5-amino-6-(5-phosphoribosylamino)uracil reductase RibD [Alphaproteobacteria bacterium]